jgi:hypothetical protein
MSWLHSSIRFAPDRPSPRYRYRHSHQRCHRFASEIRDKGLRALGQRTGMRNSAVRISLAMLICGTAPVHASDANGRFNAADYSCGQYVAARATKEELGASMARITSACCFWNCSATRLAAYNSNGHGNPPRCPKASRPLRRPWFATR